MDQLDEESFLDELMSQPREAPWQACPAGPQGGMMMMSDLLFYGAAEAKSGMDDDMDVAPFEDLRAPMPMPAPAPPGPDEQLISFDCLSEVCNPYRSCVGVVPAAGRAPTDPLQCLHDAMEEDETSRDKAHLGGACGGPSSLSPAPFVFGSGGSAGGASSVSMTGVRHRSKLHGSIPSKNLMAERRRRKRLNDRLSNLRSIVPRISKMDRTSILGDTIDYVNKLTERIKVLEEEIGAAPEDLNLLNTMKDFSSGCRSELPARNSTKFGVEKQGGGGTRIEMCCPANPGVLLSTLGALEALGLEIEQCVASCFSDFCMQASCLQVEGKKQGMSTDEIKQALFRSAGYGGRCL